MTKGLVVMAIPVLALVAVIGAGLVLQLQERGERRAAISANALARSATTVLADAVDAETGVRGYAATGDPAFLDHYAAAVQRLAADLRSLRSAAAAEGQSAGAEALAATAGEVFGDLAAIRSMVDGGPAAATLGDALRADKQTMDQLRWQAHEIAAEPLRLVAQKREAITRLESAIMTVQLIGLALGVMASVVGVSLFASGISQRVRIAADNAGRLGRGELLRPAPASADELGQLGTSLTQAEGLLASRLTELTAARDEALRATQTKNTFLSRTSHELRTPLNAILGFAQLLEMSDFSDEDRDSVVRIIGAGRHLLALINELIDIARVEAGDLKLSLEPVPLCGLTDTVITLMGPLAAARGVKIEQRCADDALAALADQLRLRQIMVNLASNAVKYNHQGGMIRIECRAADRSTVELAVTDTGIGLSSEEIDRIFVPFERLEAEQHGIEGSGIGLPLALALTEAMDGTLTVNSVPGAGSTFTVRLPRAADIPPGGTALVPAGSGRPPSWSVEHPNGPMTVLSIEDNAANSELLARLLQRWPNTHLRLAGSGHAGLDLADRHPPDLVLLDLHLPDLSGEEVFARLRAEPATADVPIVILSADATPGTIRRLLARGAAAYLTKPLDLYELGEVLTKVMGVRAEQNRADAAH
jgi:signal transduction histidine kinase/ActR/RegA family two-component response regulator